MGFYFFLSYPRVEVSQDFTWLDPSQICAEISDSSQICAAPSPTPTTEPTILPPPMAVAHHNTAGHVISAARCGVGERNQRGKDSGAPPLCRCQERLQSQHPLCPSSTRHRSEIFHLPRAGTTCGISNRNCPSFYTSLIII